MLVQSPELAQAVQAGPVSGGEKDRVDLLASGIAPDHLPSVERDEHRTSIDATLSEGLLESDAVGDYTAAGDLAQPHRRQGVEPGLAKPIVDVVATHALGDEPHGVAGGDRDRRDRREFV